MSTNRILPGVQCFAWNKDGSMAAICPTNNEIWIFETQSTPDVSKWTKVATLKEHFSVISSLDWHPKTNLLLSASTDRSIIVWEQGKTSSDFQPQIGMIKEQKANLDATWNHDGTSFCVGSSSGNVYIGTYSEANNFWVAHSITKKPAHKASVVCVRFDPLSGRAVASASLDGSIQINSCCPKDATSSSAQGPFGKVTSYGETLVNIQANGWCNFISWSPNASQVAFGTQDCELNFAKVADAADGKAKIKPEKVNLRTNPLLSGHFLEEGKFVGSGFDKVPYLYELKGSDWTQTKTLDEGISKTRQLKTTNNKFKDMRTYFNPDIKLSTNIEMKETNTHHANYINCFKPFGNTNGKPLVLSSSDINGYLVWWDVSKA